MGESSVLVLGGQRALPKKLEEAGFAFRWYDLEEALADVLEEAGFAFRWYDLEEALADVVR